MKATATATTGQLLILGPVELRIGQLPPSNFKRCLQNDYKCNYSNRFFFFFFSANLFCFHPEEPFNVGCFIMEESSLSGQTSQDTPHSKSKPCVCRVSHNKKLKEFSWESHFCLSFSTFEPLNNNVHSQHR